MSLFSKFFIILIPFYANFVRAAEPTIIKTVENVYGPAGKVVEIKNVDFIEYTRATGNFYGKDVTETAHDIHVYVWSKYNLEQANKENFEVEEVSGKHMLRLGAKLVGKDDSTGYFVYRFVFLDAGSSSKVNLGFRVSLSFDLLEGDAIVSKRYVSPAEPEAFRLQN